MKAAIIVRYDIDVVSDICVLRWRQQTYNRQLLRKRAGYGLKHIMVPAESAFSRP